MCAGTVPIASFVWFELSDNSSAVRDSLSRAPVEFAAPWGPNRTGLPHDAQYLDASDISVPHSGQNIREASTADQILGGISSIFEKMAQYLVLTLDCGPVLVRASPELPSKRCDRSVCTLILPVTIAGSRSPKRYGRSCRSLEAVHIRDSIPLVPAQAELQKWSERAGVFDLSDRRLGKDLA